MTPRSLQFSSFTLDLDRMCLHGPAGQAELRPKSFEVLRYLVNHSGRVIGKEELIKAVWLDVTVTDESLTRCISDIRRAIGDGSQEVIKTVPRRGYLLDVPVSATVVAPMTAPLVAETMEPNNLASLADRVPNHELDENVLAGERKHVTVLCADLMASLELAAQRDPEKALAIFEAVLPIMTQAVHRYEGTLNVTTGDGIVALFGAPLAQEDHAVRACYAALQMQQAVNRYAQALHNETGHILLRAGLNSGEVVIRPIASDPRGAYRAMGPTVHVAARLGLTARPGTLLVSAATLRLAKGFVHVKTVVPAGAAGHRK
jgi:class 3 adenylate cyclase